MTNTRTLLCAATLLAVTAAVTIAATQPSDRGDFSKPTVHHDILDKLWGKWDYMLTVESDDGETESLVLEADYRWALGGRFLVGGFDGYIDGGFFQAREILGYDSYRSEYRSVWVDNNTTAFTMSTGEYIARTRTLTFKGVQDNVEKDVRDEPFTFVYRFVDKDHFQIEVWRPNPAGKMVKGTTVSATRMGIQDD
jgi:hypothetical protein